MPMKKSGSERRSKISSPKRYRLVYRWEHYDDGLGPFWSQTGISIGYQINALAKMTGVRAEIRNYIDHNDWRCGLLIGQLRAVQKKMTQKDHKLLSDSGYDFVVYKVSTFWIKMGDQQVTFNCAKAVERRVIKKGYRL